MNIQQIIDFADSIKPNAFSYDDKVVWLNEVEGVVQTDVLLRRPEEIVTYSYNDLYEGSGLSFPNDQTLRLPLPFQAHPGGRVTLSGLREAAGNELMDASVLAVEEHGTVLRFAPGTFAQTNVTDSGDALLEFDGSTTELLAPPPFQKLYYTYLMAMMDFANGEYGKYQNTIQLFNSYLTCYARWVCAEE